MTIVLDISPSGLTLTELLTEFYARGYDYLDDGGTGETRAKRWINQSINELCEQAQWPFLQGTTTGTSPLTIADVRQVLSVVDSTTLTELSGRTRRWLIETITTDLTETGTPVYWYLEGQTLQVQPSSTSDTLSVRYIAVPTDLSADDDVSIVPSRYSNIVIDMAVARGLKDSDNYEAERFLRTSINEQIDSMMFNLLVRGEDEFVTDTGSSEDW